MNIFVLLVFIRRCLYSPSVCCRHPPSLSSPSRRCSGSGRRMRRQEGVGEEGEEGGGARGRVPRVRCVGAGSGRRRRGRRRPAAPGPGAVSGSPAASASTPRQFFRRPFPPPSPAKHIGLPRSPARPSLAGLRVVGAQAARRGPDPFRTWQEPWPPFGRS